MYIICIHCILLCSYNLSWFEYNHNNMACLYVHHEHTPYEILRRLGKLHKFSLILAANSLYLQHILTAS